MNLTLDPQTEQRIQRQLDRGHFRGPAEVIAHALDLLEAEEDWLLQNRDAIDNDLTETFAQAGRGETFSPEEAQAVLSERRAARIA